MFHCFNLNDLPARQGEMQKMQDCHEAYQVTMILIIKVMIRLVVKVFANIVIKEKVATN